MELPKKISSILDKSWKINLLLFISSFSVYFFYFHSVILNPNSVLSSIDGDSLKNYYTFIYYITNDPDFLKFSGLNYPFGEHIVYTDCQPLLTFIFRSLPFTHSYLIGILHYLIFLSFIVTPLVLNKIFRLLDIDAFFSFFLSLGIAILSPQIRRLDGHFALTYECVIPISILLLLEVQKLNTKKSLIHLFLFNFSLFFIHPYLGFGLSVFSFITLLFCKIFEFNFKNSFKHLFRLVIVTLLPILLFKLFMYLTDHHQNRSAQPYGIEIEVASLSSMFVPDFGPFQALLKKFISEAPPQFEGLSYVGFFTIITTLIFILVFPILIIKRIIKKELLALFFAATILLLFSFGLHTKLFELLGIKIIALNQFRALGRFAWFFYYSLPIFIIPTLYFFLKRYFEGTTLKLICASTILLFFTINLCEAHSLLKLYSTDFWKNKNIFDKKYLSADEKLMIEKIEFENPQAIIPIPLYHIGSEVYDRVGSTFGILPSIFYSFHTQTPILSNMLSRTSVTETENLIETINSYKKDRAVSKFFSEQSFLIIKGDEDMLPDEERLVRDVNFLRKNDTVSFGFISKRYLFGRKMDKSIYSIKKEVNHYADSNNIVYINHEKRSPFTIGNMNTYETIAVLDSNSIKSGSYIVSFHYHYSKKTFKEVLCNLIITKAKGKEYEWQYSIPVRIFSGFYNGYAVFEHKIEINSENKYEFIIKGNDDQSYKISDYMLRPAAKSVLVIDQKKDTTFNNFPTN